MSDLEFFPEFFNSPYLLIGIGLVLLLVGGHFLVTSSVGIALKYKVSTLVIGLTLVSFATSAPELLVSLLAAHHGSADIAIGNVFGSNIANTGLILGLSALIFTLPVKRNLYIKDWYFLAGITLLLFVVGYSSNTIFWYEGLLLVAILVYYNIKKIRDSRKANVKGIEGEIDRSAEGKTILALLGLLFVSIFALKYGAELLVLGSMNVAMSYGISERVVSLSIVALGTSLPELVASIMAAKKGEKDLAIGNVIGSNIFNLLGVLGITAMVKQITPDPLIWDFDYWWVLGFALILYPLMFVYKKNHLGKIAGSVLLLGYAVYMVLIFSSKS